MSDSIWDFGFVGFTISKDFCHFFHFNGVQGWLKDTQAMRLIKELSSRRTRAFRWARTVEVVWLQVGSSPRWNRQNSNWKVLTGWNCWNGWNGCTGRVKFICAHFFFRHIPPRTNTEFIRSSPTFLKPILYSSTIRVSVVADHFYHFWTDWCLSTWRTHADLCRCMRSHAARKLRICIEQCNMDSMYES